MLNNPCPACGADNDMATHVGDKQRPSPGDVTICFSCAHVTKFDADLMLRELTEEESRVVMASPQIVAVRDVILRMRAKPTVQ